MSTLNSNKTVDDASWSRPPYERPDDKTLTRLSRHHPTPLHIIDLDRVSCLIEALEAALSAVPCQTSIQYSVKTNYLPALLRWLAKEKIGADVVSGYELKAALNAGMDPKACVMNGPMKTREEIDLALHAGVLVNIDSLNDVRLLEEAARQRSTPVEVGLRLSPGIPASTSDDASFVDQLERAAQHDRFGWQVDLADTNVLLRRLEQSPNLQLVGIHAHLGSQLVSPSQMIEALDRILDKAGEINRRDSLRVINIGGGFATPGIHRTRETPGFKAERPSTGDPVTGDEEFDLRSFFSSVAEGMERRGIRDATLACEPGRWLVSDSMSILTRVVSTKNTAVGRWAVLDAGQNVAPWAGTGEWHNMFVVGKPAQATDPTWSVAGPLCFAGDVHAAERRLPADLQVGDLVCIQDTGAYSIGRSSNFIRKRCGVVDVNRDLLLWKAESDDDVFMFDTKADVAPAHEAP